MEQALEFYKKERMEIRSLIANGMNGINDKEKTDAEKTAFYVSTLKHISHQCGYLYARINKVPVDLECYPESWNDFTNVEKIIWLDDQLNSQDGSLSAIMLQADTGEIDSEVKSDIISQMVPLMNKIQLEMKKYEYQYQESQLDHV